ncbi:uncharacterized protein F58A4.6 [Sitodiplosis mosellana]|uniref:uncharacterized protein F58A4.6 n=1 Tax=Sitodiplosis mosellana TaxID=263140 RepID=UPI00244393A2|nr:uncharacterized protein F58A4.6 [Sitodiplosis mosellana]
MKTVSFNVKLPDQCYKFSISKHHNKCTNIEPIEIKDVTGITKSITPNQLVYVMKEFNLLNRFRRRIFNLLKELSSTTVLFYVIEPINGGLIDYAWCRRAFRITWEKVEIENLMSWLSTLGGAFSALGDSFEKCAEKAGRISEYQLKLASKSGDPSIIARCKLYYSISLIQKGRLKAAKKLVLEQYEFAKEERLTGDERTYKMCHGIWLKLQYAHSLKRLQRQKISQ